MEIKEILEQIKQEDNPTRVLDVEREMLNENEMTAEFSASSELPAQRWFGIEILDHKETSIRWHRLKDGASVRDEHWGDQIGVIEKAWLDGNEKKLRVKVRYSKNSERAKEIYKDIKDGIRRNVSIGYAIHKLDLEAQDKDNGVSTYRVTDWEPVHVAHVADPLDYNVGIGRSNKLVTDKKVIEDMVNQAIKDHENKIQLNQKGENTMEPVINVDETKKLAEQERLASIDALVRDWKDKIKTLNLEEDAKLYKASGKSAESFADRILAEKEKEYKEAAAKPTVDLTKRQQEEYSITRAVSSIMNGENCMELEISAEYARQTGRKPESGRNVPSFFLPHNTKVVKEKFGKRDVNTTATTGGEFVGTDHLGSEWIDVLKNQLVLAQLGVVSLPGRKGNIEIPKLSTGNTFGWAATENAALSESTPATTEVTLSPKRGGTYVDVSKTAIIQSDPALDIILTQDGRDVMARGFDAAALHGSGSGGQITGVKATSLVNSRSLASAQWLDILDAIRMIKGANAALSPLKWVTNANGEMILSGREKVSGYPLYLMDDAGNVARRECLVSEAVQTTHIFLGAWNQAYMAFWDALDVTVDMVTLATTFQVRITFNQLADFAVRYPQSFFYAADLS